MTEQAGNWNDFVSGHAHAHLLQTDEWAELKGRFGWRARRILLPGSDGDASRAGAMVLFRKSMGQVLAYVPRGPLVDWSDAGLTEATVARICAAARQEGAFALKIEPGLLDTAQNRGRLAAAGFHPSPQTIQPRSTVVVDLQPDEDTILARMKSKWRYNIRLAARKEVTVRELGAHELPLFQQLVSETGTREGFSVHSAAYYRAAYDLLASRWGVFLLATHRGEPLASIAVFAVGPTAWYLWGASNNHRRNLMPNHALQWEAIRWAKARGCTRKQGFGGAVERTVGAWDLPLNRSVYGLYRGLLLAKDRVATVQKRSGDGRQNDERGDARPRRAQFNPAELEPVTQEAAWEELMAQLPSDRDHVLQSWTWGAVKAASGWEVERLAVRAGGRLLGIFQFLWRQPLASLPLRVAYVPKGPLLDWSDDEAAALVLARIEKLGRRRGCLQVKIDPDVAEESAEGKRLTPLLARRGWRFSPEQVQFKNTGFTDLSETDEQLLASFKSKWRYNIRLAQRRGLNVRSGNAADLQNFYRLYRETSVRDNFLIRPFAYYEALWRTFLESQENGTARTGGTLLLAEHPQEELPVAGLFLLRHGCRTIYFNGASSERRRRAYLGRRNRARILRRHRRPRARGERRDGRHRARHLRAAGRRDPGVRPRVRRWQGRAS